jgi:hypothetical protein
MPSFEFTAAPPINPFASYYAAQASALANQGTQQDLADRATLRGLAPGLAANDPNASATALTLGAPGVAASAGLSGMHVDQRAALDQTLAVTGQISGAILQAPPEQRAALWQQLRPQMVAAGATNTPQDYPGDDAVSAHRTAALNTQQQITALGNVPTTDPYRTPLSGPAGPHVGPGGVIQGQQGGDQGAGSVGTDGNFTDQMAASESSGNSGKVNAGGYAGNFQFGAPRLAQLGLYAPAAGEIGADGKWNGQMGGQFNIPGFPQVKTKADFLANPNAQRAAFGVQVADIDAAIAQTPGADKFDHNGLRAVAQLGGPDGMQKFVATGGAYDPADRNGTHLSDYYRKFSGPGGAAGLQQAHGHPDGPLPQTAGNPGTVQVAGPGAPTGSIPAPGTQGVDDVLTRLRSGQGPPPLPQAAAAPAPAPAPAPAAAAPPAPPAAGGAAPAPAGPPLSWPAAMGPGGSGMVFTGPPGSAAPPAAAPAAPAAAPPAIPNPNALLSVGEPASAAAPQNQLMPAASAAAPAAQPQLMPAASAQPPAASAPSTPGQPMMAPIRALLPGETRLYIPGKGPAPGPTAGYQLTRMPDGSYAQIRMPGTPPNIEYQKSEDEIIGIDKDTNQVVSRVPITSGARVTSTPTAGGTELSQPGQPSRLIPYGGRPEQADAYKADLPRVEALTTAAQSAQGSMPRLNEMADLASQLATGGAAPELRAKAAALLEQMGASPDSIKAFTGMESGAAAQLFTKLAISTAGAAAKADVGANNGIQSTQLYQSANPGMNLLPDANKRVTNMMRVSAQQIQDYAQAALQHFGTNESTFLAGGNYAPLTTFNRTWLAQSNPQIGAGAIGILNGDPADKWMAGLKTPAEVAAAKAMAARVDPNVSVPGPSGSTPQTGAPVLAPPLETRVVGQSYPTLKGPMTWTGQGWTPTAARAP